MGSFCSLNLAFNIPSKKGCFTSCDFALSVRCGSFKIRKFDPEALCIHSFSSAELPKLATYSFSHLPQEPSYWNQLFPLASCLSFTNESLFWPGVNFCEKKNLQTGNPFEWQKVNKYASHIFFFLKFNNIFENLNNIYDIFPFCYFCCGFYSVVMWSLLYHHFHSLKSLSQALGLFICRIRVAEFSHRAGTQAYLLT